MMKVRVNPLVLAAALGLIGPAALEEEEQTGPVGLWQRTSAAEPAQAPLGERIEVLAIEDRVFIDDGLGSGLADQGTWTRMDDGALVQELNIDGTAVRREFRVEDASLAVRTQVRAADEERAFEARYTRLG